MSKFRPRLARYNNVCCDQVMPAPVIPICAISCSLPRPIAEVNYNQIDCNQINTSYQNQQQQSQSTSCAPCQQPQQTTPSCTTCESSNQAHQNIIEETPPQSSSYITIENYTSGTIFSTGTILTNITGSLPEGYLLCDGSELLRNTYQALFNVIGSMFGDGDGSTTFNIPNLFDSSVNGVTYIIKT